MVERVSIERAVALLAGVWSRGEIERAVALLAGVWSDG
jgi:hypothetical protein